MKNKNENKKDSAIKADENAELGRLRADLKQTQKQLKRYMKLYKESTVQIDQLQRERDLLQKQYDCISNAQSWKITKPIRKLLDLLKMVFVKVPGFRLLQKFFHSLHVNGWRVTMIKIRDRRAARRRLRQNRNVDLSKISASQRALEEATVFEKQIKFSILVPLYNTPILFLDEMIESVRAQTYPVWELCLADGSDEQHAEVGQKAMRWADEDSRIKYRKLEKNLGISENTNACIDMATGNYIALFDHDDILHPSALYEMMIAICSDDADFIYTDEATFESPDIKKIITFHFKPDFAIDNLRANNYICHFSAFSRDVLERAGRFRSEYDGSQDHDMILRLTAQASHVVHIPKLLYFWRSHPMSVAMNIGSKSYAIDAGKRAVRNHILADGYKSKVESTRACPTIYRIRYELKAKNPEKVSILIPSKNHIRVLKKCIRSILEKTTYPNYEIVIIDNGSDEQALLDYYEILQKNSRIRVLHYDLPFNYSAINNMAAENADGAYYVLLNNDIEIITPDWIEEMMMFAQREDVGAVGALLYYPDNSIQHAGIIMNLGADRIAGHSFYQCPRGSIGYMGKLCYAQDMSAVTAACMMVRADVYRAAGGFDENFPVAFNDVDFCLRLRKMDKLIVWTPFAEAYHYESQTRGKDTDKARAARFQEDCERFRRKWSDVLEAGDPYYNPNFSLDASFELKNL